MKIVDFHAHIFPDKIAKKASFNIGKFYNMAMCFDGNVNKLISIGEQCGINQFVVHAVATTPDQVESINNFIFSCMKKFPDKLIGFATLHPDYKNIDKEIERIISLGFKGIKLHPDFQCFNIDCKSAFNIYKKIEGRLPVLIHTGDSRYEYSKPNRIIQVMEGFPNLTIICAHFGGWSEWNFAAKSLAGRNLYVDTSSSLYALSPKRAYELINQFGINNVLFGSDYPMWNPSDEINLINKINLTDGEKEKIMYLNAKNLLNEKPVPKIIK